MSELCVEAGLPVPEPPSQVEEMLLSKVHVQLQIWKVNGQQTKYAGHTILFPRDNACFMERLPALPQHLDILVIRQRGVSEAEQNRLARSGDFHVKRSRILANLQALKQFHRAYRNVVIDYDALQQLPEDGSVFHSLRVMETDEESAPDAVGPAEEGTDPNLALIDESLIPNIADLRTEEQRTRQGLGEIAGALMNANAAQGLAPGPSHLTAPVYGATPVNEHDTAFEYFVQAFPFLYPSGQADLHAPRLHNVKDQEYFQHLMRYRGGRFAQHPRFRCVCIGSSTNQ